MCTSASSSAARASARSTPSPMAATSRRMAWPTVTIDSRAEVSGWRQPHRDFGHGFGDQAHVLRAAEHVGEHVEEDHRHDDRAAMPTSGGEADARGRRTAPAIRRRRDRRWPGRRRPRRRRRRWRRYRACAPGGGAASAGSGRYWRGRHWRRGAARCRRQPSRLRLLVEQVGGDRRLGVWRRRCGGDPARRSGAGRSWRTLSASWMAESASSVASLDFCGLFAISVVASLLRRTIAAARTVAISGPRHERGNLSEPRNAAQAAPVLPSGFHPIALAMRKKPTLVRSFSSSLTDC